MARAQILASLLRDDPQWQQFYAVNSFFIPYAAMDVALVALQAAGLSIDVAGQVFLLLTFVAYVGGATLLARAFGAAHWSKPLLAALLFYNGPLAGGFVNYAAGAGLGMAVIALWMRARPRPLVRLAVALLGAALVFFFHLIAAFLTVISIGSIELVELWQARSLRPAALLRHCTSVCALLLLIGMLAVSPSATEATGHGISYGGGPALTGMLKYKLGMPVHALLDGSGIAGAAVVVVGLLVLASTGWRGGMRVGMTLPAAVLVLGLAVLGAALPDGVGAGFGLDYRTIPFTATVLVCALRLEGRGMGRAWAAALMLTVLVRSALLAHQYDAANDIFRRFEAASSRLPPDSALLTALGTPRTAIPWDVFWNPPTEYLGARAIANGTFVGTVFAIQSQHPVAVDPRFADWRLILDVSTPPALAATKAFLAPACALWRRTGHAGPVYLLIVYPRPGSPTAPLLGPAAIDDPAFQLTDGCALLS